jgi:hypothetical protein
VSITPSPRPPPRPPNTKRARTHLGRLHELLPLAALLVLELAQVLVRVLREAQRDETAQHRRVHAVPALVRVPAQRHQYVSEWQLTLPYNCR